MHEADGKLATATATAATAAARGPAGTTVLVVDDEQDIRDALRLILEDAGYRVFEAENGLRAWSGCGWSRRGWWCCWTT